MDISNGVFETIRNYIQKVSGICLKEDKKYLIEQRVKPILKQYNIRDFAELARILTGIHSPQLKEDIILSITTHETSFFRDFYPFEAFRLTILPSVAKSISQKSILKCRIWSAGASTGQEAYSIAMMINEFIQTKYNPGLMKEHFSITGTDISTWALKKALSAEYYDYEIARGLSESRKKQYFNQLDNNIWKLKDIIKNMVTFQRLNLIDPLSVLGSFHVIFCRNVLIYFDHYVKVHILEQFYDMLSNDGFLLLGSMENTYNIFDRFRSIQCGNSVIYTK